MRISIYHILLLAISLAALPLKAQDDGRLVNYPMPPDSMMQLQPRCDYIINRYWQRCNFDYAMLHPDKFNEAFGAWVVIMPHASADTVHAAIDELLGRFVKKGPETLALARMARAWLYSDTARIHSNEIYQPFAKAAAGHKKIKKEDRELFAADYKRISSSAVGATVPPVALTLPDGTQSNFGEIKGASLLVFFNEPGNVDCSVARIRLATDTNVRELVERGELSIVSVYPGTPDKDWAEAAASMPEKWHKVAIPDAADYFDLRIKPQFLYLNGHHKVLAGNLSLAYLLGAFETANKAQKNRQTTTADE